MSVMIVSDEAISRVASFAAHQMLLDCTPAEFAARLRAENLAAFEQQYGAASSEDSPPLVFDWSPSTDPAQVLADLSSYLYNTQPDPNGALAGTLRSLRATLKMVILSSHDRS